MEEETGEQGESTQSGTISTLADTQTQSSTEERPHGAQNLQEPEGADQVESRACGEGEAEPSQVREDLCINDAETLRQQVTQIATNTQDNGDGLPWPPLLTEEELTPPSLSVSSHPSNTQNRPSEPCWYCLRSLDSEYSPEPPRQKDSDPLSLLPSNGKKVSYQTDPRPHFGVAWSSHSTCRPLWGSEGPCWGQRNQEVPEQMHTCPHCHLGLPPDTLRWHEAKCLLFEGRRSSKK